MKKINIALLVLLTITLTSIGYSAFESELSISNISAMIRMEKDIRISNIVVYESSDGVLSNYEDYNSNNITSSITLPYEDSYVIYNVDVTNFGNIVMGIRSIVNTNTDLKYEILNYNIGDQICSNDICTLGITKTLSIKVSNNTYDGSNITKLLQLNFDFSTYHSVTYESITNDGYPTIIMDSTNLVINFTEEIHNLTVSMDGLTLELDKDYTYAENVLTIPNVSGNIKLKSSNALLLDRYIPNGEKISFAGITLTSLGNGEYSLNGTSGSSSTYFRLTDYMEADYSWTAFNTKGVMNPLLLKSDQFHFSITHISGTYTGITASNSFKITFRQPNLTNISTMGYDFYSGIIEPNTTSVDVGMLVIFLSAGSKTFNDYRFKIHVGEGFINQPEVEDEPDPRDLTDCPSVTSSTGELTLSRCSDGMIDITSDGTIKSSYYILANEDVINIATSSKDLYNSSFATSPKYLIGDSVSIVYQYYRGLPSFTKIGTLNFVIREAAPTMAALDVPKAQNTISGDTYKDDFILTGTVSKNATGVSIYLTNNLLLNHYQFYLNDRKES